MFGFQQKTSKTALTVSTRQRYKVEVELPGPLHAAGLMGFDKESEVEVRRPSPPYLADALVF
jgi:hypothetical protein